MRKRGERYPEILEDLRGKLQHMLLEKGWSKSEIDKVAWLVIDTIREEWGGTTIYIRQTGRETLRKKGKSISD